MNITILNEETNKIKNLNNLFFIWFSILILLSYVLLLCYINIKNIMSSLLFIILTTIAIFYIFINLYN